MTEIQNTKRYDLEDRTFKFAKRIRDFVKAAPKTISTVEDLKQVIKSSGSVRANYIEANESLSKKDFILRIKISRKEAKETRYWLSLIDLDGSSEMKVDKDSLIQEATELMNIFGAILRSSD